MKINKSKNLICWTGWNVFSKSEYLNVKSNTSRRLNKYLKKNNRILCCVDGCCDVYFSQNQEVDGRKVSFYLCPSGERAAGINLYYQFRSADISSHSVWHSFMKSMKLWVIWMITSIFFWAKHNILVSLLIHWLYLSQVVSIKSKKCISRLHKVPHSEKIKQIVSNLKTIAI